MHSFSSSKGKYKQGGPTIDARVLDTRATLLYIYLVREISASSVTILMASQADLLRTLPPEVRQCVYSHLFFGDGDGTVQIEHKSRSDDWLSALPKDPLYVANFSGRRGNPEWPKEVDEDFPRGK